MLDIWLGFRHEETLRKRSGLALLNPAMVLFTQPSLSLSVVEKRSIGSKGERS